MFDSRPMHLGSGTWRATARFIGVALLLVVFAAAGTARADAATFIYFNSEPGDYIGQGQQFTLTPAEGTIAVFRPQGGVEVSFNGPTHWWHLYFVPPSGMPFTPGPYEGATRWPFQSPTTPGLSVSGDGRGCNTLTGRFTVLEAEYGASGQVVKFAADYEQHCEGGNPALFGSVRINSTLPLGPRLAVGSSVVYEGDSGVSNLRFPVTLSSPATAPVSVHYATSDGTATAGSDYTAVSGTASFPVGETVVLVNVPVLGDAVEEGDETLTLGLSNPVGASIAFGQGVGTIRNDDPYKTLIYFNSEPGDYIGQGRQFTLTLADGTIAALPTGGGVHIAFDGATWWDLYFVPPSGATLTPGVYEGATRWPFQSPTTPGLSVSGDGRGCNTLTGRFTVLEAEYGPGGQVVRFAADYEQHCEGGNPALFGSVRFNSSVPLATRLSAGSARIYEGDTGATNLRFTISLSGPATTPVTVQYGTSDSTATAGSDYTAVSGTASFPVGETAVAVDVPVLGDTALEGDETLNLVLSNPSGAPIAFGQGVGTILNDDPYKIFIYFNSEPGDYIGQGQRFTLTLSDGTIAAFPTGGGVHIAFDGATWWDLYFVPPSVPPSGGPLAPGVYVGATRWPFQSPTDPGLSVSGDGRGCNTLTGRFTVLEAEYGPNGQVLRFAADYEQHCEGGNPALFGSVRFNSSVPAGRRVVVASASVLEGDSGVRSLMFPVWLSEPSATPVTIHFATADGSATAGADYAGFAGSTGISAGEMDGVISVPVFGDTLAEADETFTVTLTGASGAALGPPNEALGTILNDDPAPQISVVDVSVLEGDPGSSPHAVFTVSLSAQSGQTVSVSYATQQGTATVNEDFTYTSGTLDFAAGATSATVSVPILPDVVTEGDETFFLHLFSPTNATLADGTATATIVDDESALSFHTVEPCRLLDTRQSGLPLAAGGSLTVTAEGACGIPSTARAVAVIVTSVSPTGPGHLRLYAAGTAAPPTSVLNFGSGQTRSGNGIVSLGPGAALVVQCYMPEGATHVVVDVSGYFE
jgi:large repetitive protein